MPFYYGAKNFAIDDDVSTYTELLEIIRKAVNFFGKDEDIKVFYSWLQQLPETHAASESSKPYVRRTFENIEDSKATKEGITVILRGFCESFVVGKKVWVLGRDVLLQLCKNPDEPRLAVVPLRQPYMDVVSLISSLRWLREIYDLAYEIEPGVIVHMEGPEWYRRVANIASAGEHYTVNQRVREFADKFAKTEECSIDIGYATKLRIAADGAACVYKEVTLWLTLADAPRFAMTKAPKYIVHLI